MGGNGKPIRITGKETAVSLDPVTGRIRVSHKDAEWEVGGQAVLGRQSPRATPWLTERHGSSTYREKREAALRQRRRREEAAFASQAKKILTDYRGLLCMAVRERNGHFFEGLGELTYVEYLLDCLEQCPGDVYADKKAVRRIGEIERRTAGWD